MCFKKKVVLSFLVCLMLSAAIYVYAEEPQEAASSEEKKETGIVKAAEEAIRETLEAPVRLAGKLLAMDLGKIVVTPWRTQEYAFNVSKGVSVITAEDIKNSAATTVPELLNTKAGIVFSEQLNNPKGATVDIRGYGEANHSNVLVLVDGRRTNQIDLSGVDWAQIDLENIERIEIVRGGSSVLYGDNATGGVINIITKKGRSAKPTTKFGAAYGSFAFHKEYGTFEGYHDIMDYFFSYSHQDKNGYRENNSYKANDWFAHMNFHPVECFEYGTSFGFHRDKYGMPGSLTALNLSAVRRRGTVFADDNAITEELFLTSDPKVSLNLANHMLTALVSSSWRHRESHGLNPSPPWGIFQTDHEINSMDMKPKLELSSNISENINNTFMLGTDFFKASDHIFSGDILATRDDVYVNKTTLGLYGYDKASVFDRFLFNAGYRYEWAYYDFDQVVRAINSDDKGLNEWSYELGGGYKYNPTSQVYINYSRTYRYPNTEEYYQPISQWGGGLNATIRQQTGRDLEIGMKDNSLDWLSLNANYFRIDNKNEIYFDHPTFLNTNYQGKVLRRGFEIEAQAEIIKDRFIPYITYTRQHAKFEGGPYDNNHYPFVPMNKLSAGIALMPLNGLTCNVGLNYVGSRPAIGDQRNRLRLMSSYTTVDTKLSYKWKNLTLYGGINNLLNRKYSDYAALNFAETDVGIYPAPGISFEIGAETEF